MRLLALLGFCIVALAGSPASAVEWEGDGWRATLDGSVRTFFTHTKRTDAQLFAQTLGFALDPNSGVTAPTLTRRSSGLLVERLRIDLEVTAGDHWTGKLVYDNEGSFGEGVRSLESALGRELGTGTWQRWDRTISTHRGRDDACYGSLFCTASREWRHLVYRGWLRYAGDAFELTLGRQRIALGRGRLWNPTDLFNPITPLSIQADQRIGQDAAVARVRVTEALWAMFIVSPQNDWDDYRSAVRLEFSTPDFDAAAMLARIGRDDVAGVEFATNVGGAAVRGEATFTWSHQGRRSASGKKGENVAQWVLSADYTFDIFDGLYFLAEHFFNDGTIDLDFSTAATNVSAFSFSRLVSRVRHQTGFQLSGDVTPLLRASLLVIHDWNRATNVFSPNLTWSARDDLEVTVGAQLFSGDADDGEYGSAAPVFFALIDFYF